MVRNLFTMLLSLVRRGDVKQANANLRALATARNARRIVSMMAYSYNKIQSYEPPPWAKPLKSPPSSFVQVSEPALNY